MTEDLATRDLPHWLSFPQRVTVTYLSVSTLWHQGSAANFLLMCDIAARSQLRSADHFPTL